MTQEAGTPPDFWGRIQKMIDDAVAKLARSGMLRNASISDGGLTIKGGFLRLLTTAGLDLFYVGPMDPPAADGSPQQGWRLRRADGTTALVMVDQFPTDSGGALNQALNWFDRTGNVVMADDTNSGQGIARPYVPAAFYPAQATDFLSTSSTTFITLHRAILRKQQPRLTVAAWGYSDVAGATGEVRVMVNGVQLGSTATTTNTSVALSRFGPAAVAGAHLDELWVEIQARVASGSGTVRIGPALVDGRQS